MAAKKKCPVMDHTTRKRRPCNGEFLNDDDTYCKIHGRMFTTPQLTTAQSLPQAATAQSPPFKLTGLEKNLAGLALNDGLQKSQKNPKKRKKKPRKRQKNPQKPQTAGYLIDFDMASYWDSEGSDARSRTGTPLYMALAARSDTSTPIHLPWYDIKSAFWVLLFGEGRRADPDFLSTLDGMDFENLENAKTKLLMFSSWEKLKKMEFMQGHVGLLLSRLRGFLFDYDWERTKMVADRLSFDESYKAERFQAWPEDDMEALGKNVAEGLKAAVEIFDEWFEECIDGLQRGTTFRLARNPPTK
jgi:Fungal protein kinase